MSGGSDAVVVGAYRFLVSSLYLRSKKNRLCCAAHNSCLVGNR